MAKITAPVEGFNGSISDVHFVDSVAETGNLAVIGYCQTAGYTVEFDGGSPDDGVTTLKGAALDAALDDAGLDKTGTADEKRARLAEAQPDQVQ